jgi:hypothetical protein
MTIRRPAHPSPIRGFEKQNIGAAMSDVRPFIPDAADGSRRLALDAAATRDRIPVEESEMSLGPRTEFA